MVKNPLANAGGHKKHRFDPWVGRTPLEEGMATHLLGSYLENPMDRGTWRATVHRVAQSWTQLKGLSRHARVHVAPLD